MIDQTWDVASDIQTLRRALPKLGLDHRVVLVLRYYCHLSTAQTATLLQTNRQVVLSRLHRARQKLRELMEYGELCPGASKNRTESGPDGSRASLDSGTPSDGVVD